jgi:indolepyruvate ferredoxin oxidoreductase alpha subunit
MNPIEQLCADETGKAVVLQGNIAFAVGCVRSGIHAADGYPGTPSTEVIDKGLSLVQDKIGVGWSVNEAVAAATGLGRTLAGDDCVVTMKIPGLYQAADIFTSGAFYQQKRGALVYYVASDFTPSSTQHLVDPRYMIRSCFLPIFEPRNHQEMHEAAEIAADISRAHNTPVVVLACGTLCHSEGLVRLSPHKTRERVELDGPIKSFMTLPGAARVNYERTVTERMPALERMAEESPLNHWHKGSGKLGVITYGATELFVREVRDALGVDMDILSLAFTNPLPVKLIREFCAAIKGDVHVIEDGYRFVQEELERLGLTVVGKQPTDVTTEWSPALIAAKLGLDASKPVAVPAGINRPPMICAGCPYRLFGEIVGKMRTSGKLDVSFGDIGCNTLLYFMNAIDTGLAMGASEAKRAGYVLSRPEQAAKCISVLGDGTECHSGLDSTRNTLFRHVPGIKVILDNHWTAMTGGQPGPTSPVNLAGQPNVFDLEKTLEAHGAKVVTVSGYDRKAIRAALKQAQEDAGNGVFTTLVVRGTCIRKVPKAKYGQQLRVNADLCKRCGMCQICPGIQADAEGLPSFTNLCSGCVGETPACLQMCPTKAIEIVPENEKAAAARVQLPAAPEEIPAPDMASVDLPKRLAVAIRGVGGQGNLFFGRVLTQLAFLAGYGETNVVKGETHGMAQMGGPVISTFSCGEVSSPVLLPGTADCLVSMEMSEVYRPGFVEMLRPGGMVLLATTRVLPPNMDMAAYPTRGDIEKNLSGYRVLFLDVLKEALALGDAAGRCANVVMVGALSTLKPFSDIPAELWLAALKKVSPKPAIWASNYAAFNAGRNLI